MEKNLKKFAVKSVILVLALLAVTFIFRFPIDYFNLKILAMNTATRIFSKSDALKIMALAILFFALYYKERISKINHEKQNYALSASFIFLGLITVTAYYFLRYLANAYDITTGIYFVIIFIASSICLIVAFALFAVGIFSFKYLKDIYKEFKKELWITGTLTVIAYFLLMLFQSLWPYFSYSITRILYRMFEPFYPVYLELARTPILDVNGFSVAIAAPCAGIESIFLFAAFSIGIYSLDHKRIKKTPFIIATIIGIIGIYFVNILRLFLLILTGIYISPDFAVGMFHTNVGWILFVIYFLIYYYIIRKFIYKPALSKQK
jgi:exosortase/archaeosortase family protein